MTRLGDNGAVGELIVGRERPLATLRDACQRADKRRGALVLVAGEPGIGKTALLAAAAGDAASAGALVVSGECWDGDGVPGYWPWIQVVRGVARAVEPDEWDRLRLAAGDALGRLLGEPGRAPTDVRFDEKGFALFDAVTTLLVEVSRTRPLVVMIDDLHWADGASVRMLEFVARHTALQAVLLVAAYRDVELDDDRHPLQAAVRALHANATIVALGGLDIGAVRSLVESAGFVGADASAIAEIHRRTGGNPFFIEQTARLWDSTGSIGGVAPGVRDAVERRLARQPSACVELLSTAALLGAEFGIGLLAAATDLDVAEASRRLQPAMTAHLLAAGDGATLRFVHDLVRETLRGWLDESDRRKRHAAVSRAMERSPALTEGVSAALIALHAYLAVPDVEPTVAVGHLVAAANDASGRLAFEEACGHLRRALVLIPAGGPERVAVALQLGAEQRRAGELEEARATFGAVLDDARVDGDAEAFARAALGLHGLGHHLIRESASAVALVDEARSMLTETTNPVDRPLLARLLAAGSQARTHRLDGDRAEGERLSAEAVELARGSGDDEALFSSLFAHHDAIWRPGTAPSRLALAEEMTTVAGRLSDSELELHATLLRLVARLEAGDPRALNEYELFVALAERTRLPRFRYLARSRQGTMATLTGDFAAARECIDDARSLGRELGEVDAEIVWVDQIWELDRLEGRFDDLDELINSQRANGDPHLPVLEAIVALDRGDTAVALARVHDVEALGARWPTWAQLMWLTFQAQLGAAALEPGLRAAARAAIAPYRDDWAVLAGAVIVNGPFRYWSAMLEAADRRWDDAIEGFTAAEHAAALMHARPWSILARLGRAEAHLTRRGTGDVTVARSLLSGVQRDAAELGMRAANARSEQLLAVNVDGASRADEGNAFCFDGQVWTLSFRGDTALVPDTKGLHDLHTLLANRSRDIAAVTLLNPDDATSRMGADAVLDERAKAEYRHRISDLDERIERALARHDDERAATLEAERDAVLDELRHATGLGGRPRRLGDDAERARKTVTARIRDTLRRLDERHPLLAEHLRASVSTGSVCGYRPDTDICWKL